MNFNYLFAGIQETLTAVKKRKFSFILLVLLQLVFFVFLGYVLLHYQLKILQNVQGIVQPLQEAENIQQEEVIKSMLPVYENYQALVKNISWLLLWLILFFFFFQGGLWLFSQQLLAQKKESWKQRGKEIIQQWLKFITSSLVLLVPFFALCYFILKWMIAKQIAVERFYLVVEILLLLLILIYYFLLVAFALLGEDWKKFIPAVYFVALRNLHRAVPVLIINIFLISGSLWLLYLALAKDLSFWLVLTAAILFLVLLVLNRIFWIACLQQLRKIKEQLSPREILKR